MYQHFSHKLEVAFLGKQPLKYDSYLSKSFCENTTAKKPETSTELDLLSERANISSKTQLAKLAQEVRKSQIFETNLDTK